MGLDYLRRLWVRFHRGNFFQLTKQKRASNMNKSEIPRKPGAGRPIGTTKENSKVPYATRLRLKHIYFLRRQENAAAWLGEKIEDGIRRENMRRVMASANRKGFGAGHRGMGSTHNCCGCGKTIQYVVNEKGGVWAACKTPGCFSHLQSKPDAG